MRNFKTAILLTTALVAGFASTAVRAQGIETVVVTAEKRARDVQKVAMSIDVKTAEELKTFGVSNFQALDSYVPNLLYQKSPSNGQIFIRGFGSQAANYGFDQSVSLYVDNIYAGRIRQFMAPFFDVERIEIMRGPQGALLGKNTAAGAVSIVTKGPSDVFEAEGTALYNIEREGVELSGFVTGPLTDKLSGRLTVQYVDLDGYIDNTFNNTRVPTKRDILTRASLRYEDGENFDVTARFEFGDSHSDGNNIVRISPVTGVMQTSKAAGPVLGGIPETDQQDNLNGNITANIGNVLGDHTLTVIGGYSHYIENNVVGGAPAVPVQNWISRFREKFDQGSTEVRLLSPTGQTLEYILGVYWDTSDYYQLSLSGYQSALGNPALTGQIHYDYNQNAKTYSAFGMATWNVTDDLRILGSMRYTANSKSGRLVQVTDSGTPLNPPQNLVRSISEDNFDPSVTLQYDVMDEVMAYFTYGRGSKAGGFVANRAATAAGFVFGGERSTNYEVGLKSKWFDDTVLVNISLFRMPFEDLQVSFYNPVAATFVTGNAAEATSQGMELELGWAATPELQFDAGLAYLEAVYDNFLGASCLASEPASVCSTAVLPSAPNSQANHNLAGYTIPGVSKWSGNLRATYKRQVSEDFQLTLVGGMNFRSTFNTTSDMSPIYGVQKSYAKFDMRVELSDAVADKWSVAVIGKNLTDEQTSNFGFLWPIDPPATGVGFLQEGRMFMLEGRIRFQ